MVIKRRQPDERKPRGPVPQTVRDQRKSDAAQKRLKDQAEKDKAVEDMIKRSIDEHGA